MKYYIYSLKNFTYLMIKIYICSCNFRIYFSTVIIPNKEGVTYITEVCSSNSINLGFCSTKNCTADSKC